MTISRFGQLPLSVRKKSSRKRRPAGLSRRRKKQLGFETLEDRRVMSAESPVVWFANASGDDLYYAMQSYSSSTEEGALAILQRELERYGLGSDALSSGSSTRSIPTDPLLSDQWHLINTGQQVGNPDFQVIFATAGEDINVAPVWNQNIFGNGVLVGVYEPGAIETTHPDLAGNIHPTLSFDGFPFEDAHATAVAGLIGAISDNGLGGTGVAPGAIIIPMSGADPNDFITNELAFSFAAENGLDIVNHSWGPSDLERSVFQPTQAEILALRDSIVSGRDGLGVIHVWAAGNGADGVLDSANFDGYVNSRYTIGVTGVDHDGFYNNVDGTVTAYPEIGTSVLVAAPTGSVFLDIVNDTGIGSGIVTTDLTGESGFNTSDNTGFPNGDRDFLDDIDFTSRFNGTSASAPMVSGVIALMLEANPNLSWRDVQEILVRSARQNAKLGEAADGFDQTFSQSYANTWIINQLNLFHDPDPWDATIDPALQTFVPTLDPNLTYAPSPTGGFLGELYLQNHYAPAPATMTNGAGYTISMGFGTHEEWYGYAHGIVDAELAVQLAQQWHTKNQVLPDELTFTTDLQLVPGNTAFVPRSQNTGEDNGDFVVPGGLGGETGFIDYYAEYFDDDPFMPDELDDLLDNRRSVGPIEFRVPDNNSMVVENVEITLTIDNYAEALDHLRAVLVSPSGTHSELIRFYLPNEYTDDNVQIRDVLISPDNLTPLDPHMDTAGSVGGTQTFTFSTNRSWGERSDNALIFDPTTMEPVIDTLVGLDSVFNPGPAPVLGDLLQQGWQLHFENWGDTDLNILEVEVAWHGSPIGANTQRIQGLVGVDDNEDDLFNYSRVIQANVDLDGDPTTNRLGEIVNLVDPNQESMGANVTVSLRRASDNVLVDQFVTGADGNYYFDVVPGNYIISVEDPLGRTAVDDSLTPAGFLPNYSSEWLITSDFFQAWDYDANLEVPINPATGAPFAFLDGNELPTQYHVNHINFLLDPGPPPAPQADFTGTVFADTNGDGVFNSNDTVLPDARVFGDVNRNGQFDPGEIFATTNASGQYSLTIPIAATTVVNVGVIPPANWTAINPGTGFQTFFVEQGDTFTGVNFFVQPPATATAGDGTLNSGIIMGFVFNDINGDGVRQANEAGVANTTVYVDMNNSGAIDAGDRVTQTNSNGAYVFAGMPNGTHLIRLSLDPSLQLTQTFPTLNLPQSATITAGGTVPNLRFGVRPPAGGGNLDFGDLPNVYGTTLASNGPRHPRGIFFLGNTVDSESNGIPSTDALGDDTTFTDDEDGVTVDPLVAGGIGRLEVVASRHGGYLQGWVDFNGDGDFNDTIGGVSEQIIVNRLLDPGMTVINFAVPATIDASTVYARFRYGEFGLGPLGLAQVGEVEDYVLAKAAPLVPLEIANGPDFNHDGEVSGLDFLAWQRGVGKTANVTANDGDSDGDGDVDGQDLADWEAEYGANPGGGQVAALQAGESGPTGQSSESSVLAPQFGVEFQSTSFTGGNEPAVQTSSGSEQPGSNASLDVAARGPVPVPGTPVGNVSQPTASETIVDSTLTRDAAKTNSITSLTSESQRRFQHVQRFDRDDRGYFQFARIETLTTETSFQDSVDLADLGFVMRDRALDRIFSRREKLMEQLPWNGDEQDDDATDALEAVLGEQIEWRFA